MNTKLFLIATSLLMVMNGVNVGYTMNNDTNENINKNMENSQQMDEQYKGNQDEEYRKINNENDENNNINSKLNINEFQQEENITKKYETGYKHEYSESNSSKKDQIITFSQKSYELENFKQIEEKIINDYNSLCENLLKNTTNNKDLGYYEEKANKAFTLLYNQFKKINIFKNLFNNADEFRKMNPVTSDCTNMLNSILKSVEYSNWDQVKNQIQLLESYVCLSYEGIKYINEVIPNSLKTVIQDLFNTYKVIINKYYSIIMHIENNRTDFITLLKEAIQHTNKIVKQIQNIINQMKFNNVPTFKEDTMYQNFFVAYYNVKHNGHKKYELIHALIPMLCNGIPYEILKTRLSVFFPEILELVEKCAARLFDTRGVQEILGLKKGEKSEFTKALKTLKLGDDNNDNYEKYNNNKHIKINQNNNNYQNNFNKYNNENGHSNYNNNFNNTINQYNYDNESEDNENNESFSNEINNSNSLKNSQFNKRNKYSMNLPKKNNNSHNFQHQNITTPQGSEFEEAFEFVTKVKEGKNPLLKPDGTRRNNSTLAFKEEGKYKKMKAIVNSPKY